MTIRKANTAAHETMCEEPTQRSRARRSRRSRRRPDATQPSANNAAAAKLQTTRTIRLSASLRASMLNLGRVIDDALDLAESLLATDFKADCLTVPMFSPVKNYYQAVPGASIDPSAAALAATGTTLHTVARTTAAIATTPSRSAVQAARAVCEKLNSALVATEAARLSTHIANLKLTSTPPHMRFSTQLQHPQLHPAPQQPWLLPQTARGGNLTSRALRFCQEVPTDHSSNTTSSQVGSGGASGASMQAASLMETMAAVAARSGCATARGPSIPPLLVGLAAAERSSPLRPLLTARPSHGAAGGSIQTLLGLSTVATTTSAPTVSSPSCQHQQQHHHSARPLAPAAAAATLLQRQLKQQQRQLLPPPQTQQNHTQQPPAGPASVPRLALSLCHRQSAGAWQQERDLETLATVTAGADALEPREPPSSFSSSPAFPSSESVLIPLRMSHSSPAAVASSATLSGAEMRPVARRSPTRTVIAAATGVTPPGDNPLAAVPVAVAAAVKGVPMLRLPLQEGMAGMRPRFGTG